MSYTRAGIGSCLEAYADAQLPSLDNLREGQAPTRHCESCRRRSCAHTTALLRALTSPSALFGLFWRLSRRSQAKQQRWGWCAAKAKLVLLFL
eukprot:3031041-Pleurochrysis_carterae.AAC.1